MSQKLSGRQKEFETTVSLLEVSLTLLFATQVSDTLLLPPSRRDVEMEWGRRDLLGLARRERARELREGRVGTSGGASPREWNARQELSEVLPTVLQEPYSLFNRSRRNIVRIPATCSGKQLSPTRVLMSFL